ncbi:hypothetical protein Q7P37_006633 [Cladosporium fusiforme]
MSQGSELLVAEVDRVVNSPYPTQLKELHTIACQKCSDGDILEWAAARPCQIDALARNLIRALQQWPYVLEIITKFCASKNVRDALLRHEPTLLFQTVTQAVNGDWKHSNASIAMLSHPLPRHITLPAASQNLFLGIVDYAAQQPSTASIKPIYQLLKGGLAPLLGLLSHETLTQLERHFVAVLRNTIGQEDQCLTLYCLAIMKAIVTAADEDPSFSAVTSYETQELLASTPNSPRWKPKGMQQYFTGGKAQKTLHLIVLRVLWASRATEGDTIEQTVECLGLANELIMFLPEATREAWCNDNPIIVRKLQEKACQVGLDARVQLPAFAFICSLCRSKNIPETMVDQLAVMLCQTVNLTGQLSLGPEPSIKWFAALLNGVQLAETFGSITSFAARATPADVVRHSETVISIVEYLSKSLKVHEPVVDGALAALSSAAVAQHLTSLKRTLSSDLISGEMEAGTCTAAVMSGRKSMGHAVTNLFLSAALAADHSQTDVASEIYPLLIETHALTVATGSPCVHVITQSRLQHKKEASVPTDLSCPGADWQDALAMHLHNKVQQDHSALSAVFSNACADLERRCSEVEAPLREEQEKRKELQNEYDNLYRAYTSLEDSKNRVEMRADALDAEKGECVRDLEQSRDENDGLLRRIDELEASLRRNQRQAQEQLEEMKRDFANDEMIHAANLAQSEERLEELEAKLSSVQTERDNKEANAAHLQSELADARSRKEGLEVELQTWQATDEDHKGIIASAEQARALLESRCASLLADLTTLQQSKTEEKAAHQAEIARLEQTAHEQVNAMREQHSLELERAQKNLNEGIEGFSAKLASAQEEFRQAQADQEAQVEKRDKKLAECHKKIEHLKNVCAEKDDQIAEANAMRSNLMAAMGLGKMNQASQSVKRRSTRSAVDNSELFDNTETSMPFIDILGAAKAANTQVNATQDNSQFAPSPKRARSRRSMAPPTQPRVSAASRATRSSTQGRIATQRQPLVAISGNLSPSKGANKTPGPSALKGFDGAFDDTTFDGSDVFASTPGLQARDGEVLPDDETELV